MEITNQQLKNLFTIKNMLTIRTSGGKAGDSVYFNNGVGSVAAVCLTDVKAGDAIALLTDKGNWYLIGDATLNTVQSTRRIIEYRKTDDIKPKISNLYYLYSLNNKVYASNNIKTDLINLPDNFSTNIYRSYIHNDGGKYRLAFSNGADNIGNTILNYASKSNYYTKVLDGVLTQANNNPYVYFAAFYSSITYKGSCIWKSNSLSPVVHRVSDYGELAHVIYQGEPPFDTIASGYIDTVTHPSPLFYEYPTYNASGKFNSPTYFYTLDYDTETYKTGTIDYTYSSSYYNFPSNSPVMNNITKSINKTTIGNVDYDYSFTKTTITSGETSAYAWQSTDTYTFSSTYPVICFKKGLIYCTETNSTFSRYLNGNSFNLNRNVNYYYDNNQLVIQLNTDSILKLISDTELIISSPSSITLTTSTIITNSFSGINGFINLPDKSEFINKQIMIGKKNNDSYILYRGVINDIKYTTYDHDNSLTSVTCNITITSSENKPFISFASTNGTLIMNEGSIYTYLHVEEVSDYLTFANIIISNNNMFMYTTDIDVAYLPYADDGGVYDAPPLIPARYTINNRIQKDNLNNNNIYITNIPDFNKGGNLVAYIEVWNIGTDGKILYQKTLTQKLSNIPKNATLYAASYYK